MTFSFVFVCYNGLIWRVSDIIRRSETFFGRQKPRLSIERLFQLGKLDGIDHHGIEGLVVHVGLYLSNGVDHLHAVKNGTECRAKAEDGIAVMKILDAIYESARTGHEVIL